MSSVASIASGKTPELIDISAAKVLGLPALGRAAVPGYKPGHEFSAQVPARDQDYVFRKDVVLELLVWMTTKRSFGNDGLWISGPTGSSKSTIVEQLCNRLSIPVWVVQCSGTTEAEDIIGGVGLRDGSTGFIPGPALKAHAAGGVLLLEEADRLRPDVMGSIAPLMENRAFEAGGQMVDRAGTNLFSIVVTSNTRGGRDSTGLWQGAKQQNLATLHRFQTISVGYMDADTELRLLDKKVVSKIAGTPEELDSMRDQCKILVQVANKVRSAFQDELSAVDTVISTRVLLKWADLLWSWRAVRDPNPIKRSLDQALLAGAAEDTQQAIHKLLDGIVG